MSRISNLTRLATPLQPLFDLGHHQIPVNSNVFYTVRAGELQDRSSEAWSKPCAGQ
jgi:hypothetical protein